VNAVGELYRPLQRPLKPMPAAPPVASEPLYDMLVAVTAVPD
jgi:hypothetical protein